MDIMDVGIGTGVIPRNMDWSYDISNKNYIQPIVTEIK